MIRSLLVTALRRLARSFVFSAISLSGLVAGLIVTVFVFLWTAFELRYNRYDPENKKIFTVMAKVHHGNRIQFYDEVPLKLTEYLTHSLPEVEAVTRFDWLSAYLSNQDKGILKRGVYADSAFFHVFNMKVVAGNPATLLSEFGSVVLSEESSRLLFPNGDALGKTVLLDGKKEVKVTGIFSELPINSSLHNIQFVTPFFSTLRDLDNDYANTVVKLRQESDKAPAEEKLNKEFKSIFSEEEDATSLLFCFTDWRLFTFESGGGWGGRFMYVVIFSLAAIAILFMACINYVNIATARASQRAREIGIRKVTGATKANLIQQFMGESLMASIASAIVAVVAVYILLPLLNEIAGTNLRLDPGDPVLTGGILAITLVTGMLAGSYPAFLLSSLKPAQVLKGNFYGAMTGSGLRKALVIFQFSLSSILMYSAVLFWQQMDFMMKRDLGFDRNNILNVYVNPDDGFPLNSIKMELLQNPAIVAAGCGDSSPLEINGYATTLLTGAGDLTLPQMNGATIDEDYLETIGLGMVSGRNFRKGNTADSNNFIITQRAADLLGVEDPIGRKIKYDMYRQSEGEIIGVVQDFHNDDIHEPTRPVVFALAKPMWLRTVFVRYADGKREAALEHVNKVFKKYLNGVPLNYGFLDKDFANQFLMEQQLRSMSIFFTLIAILIASLGLLGLTIFNAQRRTKEIGIRKVLGASVPNVMMMLNQDFAKPVFISFLIAIPISYYLQEKLLQLYPYRITITALPFLIVSLLMIILVALIVSGQSYQAAIKNPTETLRMD